MYYFSVLYLLKYVHCSSSPRGIIIFVFGVFFNDIYVPLLINGVWSCDTAVQEAKSVQKENSIFY